jgi:hypothetical protein
LHNVADQSVQCDSIKQGQSAEKKFNQEVRNINWMLKEDGEMYLGCNTDARNFPIYIVNSEGILRTMTFDTQKDVTFIEFGFLRDKTMFLIYNEGEKAVVGTFMINLNAVNTSADFSIKDQDDCVQCVTLHEQDDESIMIDAYILVNRVMSTITMATVCVSFFCLKFFIEPTCHL